MTSPNSSPPQSARELWRWCIRLAGGREPLVLAAIVVILAASLGFVAIGDLISDGGTPKFDAWALKAFRNPDDLSTPVGPVWLAEIARDTTALGGYTCLVFFTAAIGIFLWLDRKHHLALFLVGCAMSGYLCSSILKAIFQRPRPDIVPHLDHVMSTSFPSGHSMNSAVVYLTLGTLLAASTTRKALKYYVLGVALFLTLAIGLSRVFLGVHYPTDVAAGWMAGSAWAMLCWVVARALQRTGQVEQPTSSTPAKQSASAPQESANT